MINIGWIGCGRHARQMLLPQLGRNDIRIAALCDRDGAALKATAAEREEQLGELRRDAAIGRRLREGGKKGGSAPKNQR